MVQALTGPMVLMRRKMTSHASAVKKVQKVQKMKVKEIMSFISPGFGAVNQFSFLTQKKSWVGM